MLRMIYESLAESFDNRTSDVGFNEFLESLSEIAISETISCTYSSDFLDVSELASNFANVTLSQVLAGESLRQIRIILGEILCAESMEKRSLTGVDCPSRGDCICPPDGLSASIMCTCEIFACLDVEDHLGPIFGFSNVVQEPCIAFVVDTTGSMAEEIAAIRTAIVNFLTSEGAVNELRCYILVPFNDRGSVDNSKYYTQS